MSLRLVEIFYEQTRFSFLSDYEILRGKVRPTDKSCAEERLIFR